jgi:hypothetical protein
MMCIQSGVRAVPFLSGHDRLTPSGHESLRRLSQESGPRLQKGKACLQTKALTASRKTNGQVLQPCRANMLSTMHVEQAPSTDTMSTTCPICKHLCNHFHHTKRLETDWKSGGQVHHLQICREAYQHTQHAPYAKRQTSINHNLLPVDDPVLACAGGAPCTATHMHNCNTFQQYNASLGASPRRPVSCNTGTSGTHVKSTSQGYLAPAQRASQESCPRRMFQAGPTSA